MELLVITVPRSDAIDDHQRGDIVEIMPDGWGWSDIEKTHPRAHIIRAPILDTHASQLLSRHPNGRVIGQKNPVHSHRIDFDLLPNPDEFKPGNRTKPIVELENDHIIAATVKVP